MGKAVVVENFHLFADLWCSVLKQMGFEEIIVLDGQEDPTRQILDFSPELVIMDVNLGKLNGFDLTRKILHESPSIRVCIISLYSVKHFEELAQNCGAMGYLCKSQPLTEIRDCLEKIMDNTVCFCE